MIRGAILAGALSLTWLFFQKPPIEFQGAGTYIVKFVPRGQIAVECKNAPLKNVTDNIFACAKGRVLVLPNPCEWPIREGFAELSCHEIGHGNGWKH